MLICDMAALVPREVQMEKRRILVIENYSGAGGFPRGELSTVYELVAGKSAAACGEGGFSAVLLGLAAAASAADAVGAVRADARFEGAAIIVGSLERDAELPALSAGADDFILLPADAQVLLRRLARSIELRERAYAAVTGGRDRLTGLYTREAFFAEAAWLIEAHEAEYYVLSSFDIDNFKIINDQYGNDKGDYVLKYIADAFRRFCAAANGICCRVTADNFAVLYPQAYKNTLATEAKREEAVALDATIPPLTISTGRCVIRDKSLAVSAIYDRAVIAKRSVKGRYDVHVAEYDETMRDRILREQKIVNEMNTALQNGNFEVWLQPQFNHSSGAMIGAEALVRWRHPIEGLIPPARFIPVFERNGFIYELDKYVWERVCALLRGWLDAGRAPLPVSVNVSRYDIFREGFFEFVTGLVERYDVPLTLFRLEITESAFARSTDQIIGVVKRLTEYGFVVEIDDFGSGYSSFNTLKDVPAEILKLDMALLRSNENSTRGGNILESIIRMAKWLGMPVIAEGVETQAQADFLRSVGCEYVQGYLYARPMPVCEFERLFDTLKKEQRLRTLKTVAALDNNTFWDPASMETLIFNSFVGGACIIECHAGSIELLRVNDNYSRELGGIPTARALALRLEEHMDADSRSAFDAALQSAITTADEAACEVRLSDILDDRVLWLRVTVRVIAQAGDRRLFYCSVLNTSAQREAELKERGAAEQLLFLNETARCILKQTDTEKAIEHTLFELLSYFGGTRAYIFELDHKKQIAANTYEVCGEGVRSERDKLSRVPFADMSFWLSAFESRRYISIENVSAIGNERESERKTLSEQGIQSLVAVPLWRGDGVLKGFIGIDDPSRQQSHIENLAAIGDYVAVLLTRRDMTAKIESDNRMLTGLMNDTPGGFVRLRQTEDGRIVPVYINDGFTKLIGLTREQIVETYGADASYGVHPDDVNIVQNAVSEMLEYGETVSEKYRLLNGNGGYSWFMIFGRKTQNENGETFLNIYYTDLSENEKTALAYRNMIPVALAAMMESSTELSFVKDRNLRYICCSRAFARMVGLKSEKDVVGKTDYDLFADATLAEQYRADDRRLIEKGESLVDYVEEIPAENGPAHYSKTSKYLLHDESGSIIGIYGSGRDVTKDMETEERLRLLLNSPLCGLGMFELTPSNIKAIYYSEGIYASLGYSREEYAQAIERDALCFVQQEDAEALRAAIERLRRDGTRLDENYRSIAKDGSCHWFNLRAEISETRGETAIMNAVQYDITERRRMADSLSVSRREYSLVLEHSGKLMYRYILAENALYMSEKTAKLLCLPTRIEGLPESVIARGLVEERSAEEFRAFYAATKRGERTGVMTIRRKVSDGSFRWFEVRFSSVFGELGEPVSAIIVFEDITDERERSIYHELDRARLAAALRTAYPVTVYVNLTKGTFRTISGATQLFVPDGTHGAIAEIIDAGARRMQEDTARAFREKFGQEALLASLTHDGDSVRMEYLQQSYDDKMHWLETIVLRVKNEYSSDVTGILLCRLIDEQKNAEEKLRRALATTNSELSEALDYKELLDAFIPGCAIILDATEKKILHIGGTLMRDFGYSKEELDAFEGKGLRGFILEEDYGPAFNDAVPEPGRLVPFFEQEYRVRKKNGDVVSVYEKGTLVKLKDGRPVYLIICIDITQRSEIEDRLRISEEELRLAMLKMGNVILLYDVETHTLTMPREYSDMYALPAVMQNIPEAARELGLLKDSSMQPYMEFYDAILRGERTGATEYLARRADGTEGWERAEFYVVLDNKQQPRKAIIAIEDTTREHLINTEAQALRENERVLKLVAEHSNRFIYRYDIAARTVLADGAESAAGLPLPVFFTPEEIADDGYVLAESAADLQRAFRAMDRGESGGAKLHLRGGEGAPRWYDIQYSAIRGEAGKPVSTVISLLDITDDHEKELAYDRYRQTIEHGSTASGVLIYLESDVTADITEKQGGSMLSEGVPPVGSARSKTINYLAKKFVEKTERERFREFFSRERIITAFSDGTRSLCEDWPVCFEGGAAGYIRSELQMVQDPYSGHIKVYTILRDVTEEKLSVLSIKKKAEMDGMTGLFNKPTIEALIKKRLADDDERPCALMIADLDNLKSINDNFGHDHGDEAIKLFAAVLRSQFRQNDIAGRVGGDEFVVFIEGGTESWLTGKLTGIMRKLSLLRIGENRDVPICGSIGVALSAGGIGYDTLFRRADKALYHVKRNGKNNFAFYTAGMDESTYGYICGNEGQWQKNTLENDELSGLVAAISALYPMIISVNLTRNSFFMMRYENYMTKSCVNAGSFDELLLSGQQTFHPDDRAPFLERFSRESLLAAFERGERVVSLTARQLGDDGAYHTVRTDAVLFAGADGEALEITLAREI